MRDEGLHGISPLINPIGAEMHLTGSLFSVYNIRGKDVSDPAGFRDRLREALFHSIETLFYYSQNGFGVLI